MTLPCLWCCLFTLSILYGIVIPKILFDSLEPVNLDRGPL